MPAEKFTPEARAVIIAALRMCAPRQTAAAEAGITDRTLRNWLAREEPEYVEFAAEVEKAEAFGEKALLGTILSAAKGSAAAPGDWRAAAWTLERRHRQRWAQMNKTEITGADGGPIETTSVSPETAAAAVKEVFRSNNERALEDSGETSSDS